MIEHLPIAISQAVHVNHALISATYALKVIGRRFAGDPFAASAVTLLTRQKLLFSCTGAVHVHGLLTLQPLRLSWGLGWGQSCILHITRQDCSALDVSETLLDMSSMSTHF